MMHFYCIMNLALRIVKNKYIYYYYHDLKVWWPYATLFAFIFLYTIQ